MTRSHRLFQRITGRLAIAATILVISSIDLCGDEPTRSSAASSGIPTNQTSGRTSVNQELQKLFEESGQQMPSLRNSDLPYANSPRMDRIQKREEKSAAPAKSKGLLSRIIGRFRREKRDHDVDAPGNPASVPRDAAAAGRRLDYRNSVVRPTVPQNRYVVIATEPETVRPPRGAPVRPTRPTGTIRPASQPRKSAGLSPNAAHLAPVPADGFVNPFEDSEVSLDGETYLDLDAVSEIPEVADAISFEETESAPEGETEFSSPESEPNPFSGLRIDAAGEFVNPFEASDASAENNEATDGHEGTAAVPLVRGDSRSEPSRVDSENRENAAQFNPFASPQFNGTESGPSRATALVDRRPAHPLIRDVSASAETRIAPASRSRRLAPIDRVPVERTQAERWRAPATPAESRSDDDRSFSEYLASKSSPQTPRNPPQDARRQEIHARRHLSGFMGFCPVELREARDLVDAVATYETRFGLNTYRFSSEESLERFKANPTRYAPAAGGADVVALVNSGEQYPGSLEFAMWYRDRLYLFGSRETMELFGENPASFADQY